jgi:hypothetical protein
VIVGCCCKLRPNAVWRLVAGSISTLCKSGRVRPQDKALKAFLCSQSLATQSEHLPSNDEAKQAMHAHVATPVCLTEHTNYLVRGLVVAMLAHSVIWPPFTAQHDAVSLVGLVADDSAGAGLCAKTYQHSTPHNAAQHIAAWCNAAMHGLVEPSTIAQQAHISACWLAHESHPSVLLSVFTMDMLRIVIVRLGRVHRMIQDQLQVASSRKQYMSHSRQEWCCI